METKHDENRRREEQLRTLGFAIARQRELKGISQTDMCTMLGYTNHAHLSRIEGGKKAPSLRLILEMADILEISVSTFFVDL